MRRPRRLKERERERELQSAEAVAKIRAPDSSSHSLCGAVLNKIFITADVRLPDDSRRCRFKTRGAANEICAAARPYSTNYSYLHGRIKRKVRETGDLLYLQN
jgi:hypothetical protein